MGDQPSGTVTFLFTDIEGSTRLWQERPEEMEVALERHDELVRTAIESHDGYVFATGGDGFAAAFASAPDGVAAAAAAQAGLADSDLIRVRMGVHSGEAQLRDGDYFGSAVNRAARVMATGHGGQVLLSGAAASLVEGESLTNLGGHRLKDLEGETVVWQLGVASFPPLRSLNQLPGNLPVQRTSFIGREGQVKELVVALGTDRLVTLTGPGGVGKSRLALQVAAELAADIPGGAWFASLGSLTDGAMVTSVIVDALGITHRRGESALDVLGHWFAQRESLLVIDNCEHVLEEAAAVVDHLLGRAGTSRILATSQAPLELAGEGVHVVAPLRGGGLASESVQLFVDRARMARADFALTVDDEDAVIEICERLDHTPLAIELAASRARGMSPSDIAERLDHRFKLLASSDRSAPGRHRTLEAAVRWSYELLDSTQQAVLRRLSVIAGSFTIEAAEAVAAGDDVEEWEVLDALLALVDKSLITAEELTGHTRYRLLETIRQFGRAELEAEGDLDERMRSAMDHYEGLIREFGPQLLFDDTAAERIEAEWQNVRAALRRAADDHFSSRFEELYSQLEQQWTHAGRTMEGVQWATELWGRPLVDADERVGALGVASLTAIQVSLDASKEFGDAAIALWEEQDTPPPVPAIAARGVRAMMVGDNEQAVASAEEALRLRDLAGPGSHIEILSVVLSVFGLCGELDRFREVRELAEADVARFGVRLMQHTVSMGIASAIDRVDPDNARDYLVNLVEMSAELDRRTQLPTAAMYLGIHDLKSGDVPQAAVSLRRALESAVQDGPALIGQIVNATIALLLREWPDDAATLLAALVRWREEHRQAGTQLESRAEVRYEAELREKLGPSFEECRSIGAAMSEAAMVDAALDALHAAALT